MTITYCSLCFYNVVAGTIHINAKFHEIPTDGHSHGEFIHFLMFSFEVFDMLKQANILKFIFCVASGIIHINAKFEGNSTQGISHRDFIYF